MDFVNVAGKDTTQGDEGLCLCGGCASKRKESASSASPNTQSTATKLARIRYTAGAERLPPIRVNDIRGSVANRCNGCRASTSRFVKRCFQFAGPWKSEARQERK